MISASADYADEAAGHCHPLIRFSVSCHYTWSSAMKAYMPQVKQVSGSIEPAHKVGLLESSKSRQRSTILCKILNSWYVATSRIKVECCLSLCNKLSWNFGHFSIHHCGSFGTIIAGSSIIHMCTYRKSLQNEWRLCLTYCSDEHHTSHD